MSDTRQVSPGEVPPRPATAGLLRSQLNPTLRHRDSQPSQLIRWRGKCVHCGATYEVTGSANVEKLAKSCEQHRGMRRPRAGKQTRAGTATLLRCVRLMIQPAIRQTSEGRDRWCA